MALLKIKYPCSEIFKFFSLKLIRCNDLNKEQLYHHNLFVSYRSRGSLNFKDGENSHDYIFFKIAQPYNMLLY